MQPYQIWWNISGAQHKSFRSYSEVLAGLMLGNLWKMAPAQGPLGWERLKTWMSNVNHFVTAKRPQPVCATFFHFLILNNSCLWTSEFSLWTDISASYMIGFGWLQPGRESSYCIKNQVSVHSYWKMPPVWLINSDFEIWAGFQDSH